MKKEHGILGLVIICLVVVALSVSGLASDMLTRLDLDLDGLLLIMVSLMMAGLFLLMLLMIAKDQGWLPSRHKQVSASSAPAAPAAPAARPPAAPPAARPAPAKPQAEEAVSVRPGEGK